MPQIHTARLYCCQELLWQSAAEAGTCGVVAVSLVSPAIVGPVAVVGVEQIDVLVVVAGQELCRREGEEVYNQAEGERMLSWAEPGTEPSTRISTLPIHSSFCLIVSDVALWLHQDGCEGLSDKDQVLGSLCVITLE